MAYPKRRIFCHFFYQFPWFQVASDYCLLMYVVVVGKGRKINRDSISLLPHADLMLKESKISLWSACICLLLLFPLFANHHKKSEQVRKNYSFSCLNLQMTQSSVYSVSTLVRNNALMSVGGVIFWAAASATLTEDQKTYPQWKNKIKCYRVSGIVEGSFVSRVATNGSLYEGVVSLVLWRFLKYLNAAKIIGPSTSVAMVVGHTAEGLNSQGVGIKEWFVDEPRSVNKPFEV